MTSTTLPLVSEYTWNGSVVGRLWKSANATWKMPHLVCKYWVRDSYTFLTGEDITMSRNAGLKFSIEQPDLLKFSQSLFSMELLFSWLCLPGFPPISEVGLFLLHQWVLQRLPRALTKGNMSSEISLSPISLATIFLLRKLDRLYQNKIGLQCTGFTPKCNGWKSKWGCDGGDKERRQYVQINV